MSYGLSELVEDTIEHLCQNYNQELSKIWGYEPEKILRFYPVYVDCWGTKHGHTSDHLAKYCFDCFGLFYFDFNRNRVYIFGYFEYTSFKFVYFKFSNSQELFIPLNRAKDYRDEFVIYSRSGIDYSTYITDLDLRCKDERIKNRDFGRAQVIALDHKFPLKDLTCAIFDVSFRRSKIKFYTELVVIVPDIISKFEVALA